jgi:hypothetical protein
MGRAVDRQRLNRHNPILLLLQVVKLAAARPVLKDQVIGVPLHSDTAIVIPLLQVEPFHNIVQAVPLYSPRQAVSSVRNGVKRAHTCGGGKIRIRVSIDENRLVSE